MFHLYVNYEDVEIFDIILLYLSEIPKNWNVKNKYKIYISTKNGKPSINNFITNLSYDRDTMVGIFKREKAVLENMDLQNGPMQEIIRKVHSIGNSKDWR